MFEQLFTTLQKEEQVQALKNTYVVARVTCRKQKRSRYFVILKKTLPIRDISDVCELRDTENGMVLRETDSYKQPGTSRRYFGVYLDMNNWDSLVHTNVEQITTVKEAKRKKVPLEDLTLWLTYGDFGSHYIDLSVQKIIEIGRAHV